MPIYETKKVVIDENDNIINVGEAVDKPWYWWLRTPFAPDAHNAYIIQWGDNANPAKLKSIR